MIERIEIIAKPSSFFEKTHREIQVDVFVDGKEYHHLDYIYLEDDVTTWFERYWETIGKKLALAMKENK